MSKVNINIDRNKYRLRWSYQGIRFTLPIGDVSKLTLKAAQAKAALIESDILFDRFDETLVKYGKYGKSASILTAWNQYKENNSKRIALTSQQNSWRNVDKCLSRVKPTLLALDKADELVNYLLDYYSPGTLKRVLIDLNAASSHYYDLKKLPRLASKPIKCFSDSEVNLIINSFQTDRFKSKSSAYCHSYYTSYVKFLAYTGCRPEEAIALTWDDIDISSKAIRFAKAYSKGILKETKNYKIRYFPINQQLESILVGSHKLVFPAIGGGYINQQTWHCRYWNTVVNNLVDLKLVKEHLRSYCLRHSFITRCVRDGLDIASIASISGNSTETIMRYYLASRDIDSIKLPEL
jgi:integrase